MLINLAIDIALGEQSGSEPVTLAEVKTHIRQQTTADDTYITAIISQARDQIEKYCGISILSREIVVYGKFPSCHPYSLPYGPVDITSIAIATVAIGAGDSIAYAASQYTVVGSQYPAIIFNGIPVYDPVIVDRYPDETNILALTYNAGYEFVPAGVPAGLKSAILNQIAWLYEHRGDELTDKLGPESLALAKLYRRVGI